MIRIRGLRKWFDSRRGRVEALRGIDLEVAEKEFCVLLGPSGCGKTTTLRSVAGLEKPDAGELEIDGALVNSPERKIYVPTEKRDIGMVFQSYAIWPHMNVFQNVSFPLIKGRKKIPKDQIAGKVRSCAEARAARWPRGSPGDRPERRAAAARGDGACDGHRAEDLADGRAAEQPRCAAARADARRAKKDHQGRRA